MDVLTDVDGAILDREEVVGSRKAVDPAVLLQTEGPDGAMAIIALTQDGRQVLTVTSGLTGEVSSLDDFGALVALLSVAFNSSSSVKNLKYGALI